MAREDGLQDAPYSSYPARCLSWRSQSTDPRWAGRSFRKEIFLSLFFFTKDGPRVSVAGFVYPMVVDTQPTAVGAQPTPAGRCPTVVTRRLALCAGLSGPVAGSFVFFFVLRTALLLGAAGWQLAVC